MFYKMYQINFHMREEGYMQMKKKIVCSLITMMFFVTNIMAAFAVPTYSLVDETHSEASEISNDAEKEIADEQLNSENKNKTNKYIIKYKSGSTGKDLSKRTKAKIKKIKSKSSNTYGKTKNNSKKNKKLSMTEEILFVETNEKIDTEAFQALLSENEDMTEIEYIQPDYELTLSDFTDGKLESVLLEESSIAASPAYTADASLPPSSPEASDKSEGAAITEAPAISETPGASEMIDPSENSENEPTDAPVSIEAVDTFNIDDSLSAAHSVATGQGITVAVIDSIIDIHHEQLTGHLTDGWDFVNDSELSLLSDTPVTDSHGTHVAGIIAKSAPNSRIMPLKVFENGKAYTSDIIEAIAYAEINGAHIVNCSWGAAEENPALKEVIENSAMLFVAAAGNNRINLDETNMYPASYAFDNVISAGSINADGGMSFFSNYGTTVDIAAWGREVESLLPGNTVGTMTGTSVSAAFVSGAAALAAEKNATTGDLKTVLKNSSDKISCLENKVDQGNKLNFLNIVTDTPGASIPINPEDDFDVFGYVRTPEENWTLYGNTPNEQASAGSSHTIVRKTDGTVWQFGYIGNSCPEQVPGLNNIVDIAARESGNIALKSDGTIWTWEAGIPQQVILPSGIFITDVEKGNNHYIALDNTGHVWTWGSSNRGQLGLNDTLNRTAPTQTDLENVTQIAAGAEHSMALLSNGNVMVWGENSRGQLGLDTTTNVMVPTIVNNISDVKKITAGGYHSMILKNDNTLWTAGSGGYGQTGKNTSANSTTFTQILTETPITDVFTNYHHNAALDTTGAVWIWGYNAYGQLGTDRTSKILTPEQIPGIHDIKSAAMGLQHTIFILDDGKIKSCGSNSYGQLGIERTLSYSSPHEVDGLTPIVSIAAGDASSFAIDVDSCVYAWGMNTAGQLGDGTRISSGSPVKLKVNGTDFDGVSKIAAGYVHTVALKYDGTVWTWGNNNLGQLGINGISSSQSPRQIPRSSFNNKTIADIVCGENHTLARADDGSLYVWGANTNGQLGIGSTSTSQKIPMALGIKVKAIAAGGKHSAAILLNDTLATWGNNTSGQLGTGDYAQRTEPGGISIYSNTAFTAVSAGTSSTIAVTADGEVIGFGANNNKCLGIDAGNKVSTPTQINGLTDIQSLEYGAEHGIALSNNQNVYVWGKDTYGQLCGNDSKSIISELNDALCIAAGKYHNLALKNDKVYTWGSNIDGQCGNGDVLMVSEPHIPDSSINYFYGTSFQDAHQIAPGTTKSKITTPEETQYYKLIAPETANYTIRTNSASSAALNLTLCSADYTTIAETTNGNDEIPSDCTMTKGLTKGAAYYIKVQGSEDNIPYELTIEKHTLTADEIRFSGETLNVTGSWIPSSSVEIGIYKENTALQNQTVTADNEGKYALNINTSEISLGNTAMLHIVGCAEVEAQLNRAVVLQPGTGFNDAASLHLPDAAGELTEPVKIDTKTNAAHMEYYAIRVAETGNYAIYSNTAAPFDLRAELFNESHSTIVSNNNGMGEKIIEGGSNNSNDFVVTAGLEANKTYYLAVQSPSTAEAGTKYSLELKKLTLTADLISIPGGFEIAGKFIPQDSIAITLHNAEYSITMQPEQMPVYEDYRSFSYSYTFNGNSYPGEWTILIESDGTVPESLELNYEYSNEGSWIVGNAAPFDDFNHDSYEILWPYGEMYWTFTPSESGFYTINSPENVINKSMWIYNSISDVYSEAPSSYTTEEMLHYPFTAGQTYYIRIKNMDDATCIYDLNIQMVTFDLNVTNVNENTVTVSGKSFPNTTIGVTVSENMGYMMSTIGSFPVTCDANGNFTGSYVIENPGYNGYMVDISGYQQLETAFFRFAADYQTARTISGKLTNVGYYSSGNETFYFKFTPLATEEYIIYTTSNDRIEIDDDNNAGNGVLTSNGTSGDTTYPQITQTLNANHTYYIIVHPDTAEGTEWNTFSLMTVSARSNITASVIGSDILLNGNLTYIAGASEPVQVTVLDKSTNTVISDASYTTTPEGNLDAVINNIISVGNHGYKLILSHNDQSFDEISMDVKCMDLTFDVLLDDQISIPLIVTNAVNLNRYRFAVSYNENDYQLITACEASAENIVSASPDAIPGTEVKVTGIGTNYLQLESTKTNSDPWSGLFNAIKLRAKTAGTQKTIRCIVYNVK